MESVLACDACESESIQRVDVECNLCVCKSCGFVFDSPRPTLNDLIEFYSQRDKYDSWLDNEESRDALWLRRLRKMKKHSRPGNLLDVGAGIGQFLHHAKPYFSQVSGTEVSASGINIAKTKYGLSLLHGSLEDIEMPPESFDNITLFHVLEHVPSPTSLLKKCRYLLRDNGVLVIAVPNEVLAWTSSLKRLGKRLGLHSFQKFSSHFGIPRACTSGEVHLSHFTEPILANLLTRVGFTVIEKSIDPYYSFSGFKQFAHAAYYVLHRGLWYVLRLNRYDTIWMVAKKMPTTKN